LARVVLFFSLQIAKNGFAFPTVNKMGKLAASGAIYYQKLAGRA